MSSIKNILKQLPFTVTKEIMSAPWGGYTDGRLLRCGLCGYKFRIGDIARWVMLNGTKFKYGNQFVCRKCDGENVVERFVRMQAIWETSMKEKYWVFQSKEDKNEIH